MKRPSSFFLILPFFMFLCVFTFLSVQYPDEIYTPTENRKLQQSPTLGAVEPKEWTSELTSYVVDQFPCREDFLWLYNRLELMQNKRFSRDTYVSPDRWLISRTYTVPDAHMSLFADTLRTAADKAACPFVYAVIPEKANFLREQAARACVDLRISDDNKVRLLQTLHGIDAIQTLDVGRHFLENFTLAEREKMYYKTDFHWNHCGAYEAAQWICGELKASGLLECEKIPEQNDFVWQELDGEKYQGDLNRRFSFLFPREKYVPFYSIQSPQECMYYLSADDSQPASRDEIIASGITKSEMTYNDISTANLGYYRVENDRARSKQHILILKDSFQNPTIDYFTSVFEEVNVIDPRSYNLTENFTELLEHRHINLVLFFYYQSNVSQELITFLQSAS